MPEKKRTNFLYRLLVSSYVVSQFSEGVILPIYAIFVQKIGGDILDAGGAMGIFLITEGLFTFLVHKRHWTNSQRIKLMIFGWAIWLVGIASYLIISNVWMLFITQVLTAIGNAVADPIFDQELSNHTDGCIEEFEWGFFEGSKSLVEGVAAIVGGIIASVFGFLTLIYVMIAAGTTSLLLILWYVLRIRKREIRGW